MEYPRPPLKRPDLLLQIRDRREAQRTEARRTARGMPAGRDANALSPKETSRDADFRTQPRR